MQILTPHDINTTINHEPRILDVKLAEALGFERPRNIRKIIERNLPALDQLGTRSTVERVINGGKATEYYLTKKQAVYIAAKSETPHAVTITIHVIEVFDAATRAAPVLECGPVTHPPFEDLEAMRVHLAMIREARSLFGKSRARSLWTLLGLPEAPPAYDTAPLEPYQALELVLNAPIGETSLRFAIEEAFEAGGDTAQLRACGVRVFVAQGRFALVPSHPFFQALTRKTRFQGVLSRTLLRLPDVRGEQLWLNGTNNRAVSLPERLLSEQPLAFEVA
jgi:hypothetical protein